VDEKSDDSQAGEQDERKGGDTAMHSNRST
jgi:hypothetical protein